ncbi:hypothetical protein [Aquimarina megaterium]|uniref:hypothetical protein n=1 Tax=Aquimarina megaterium TaxID=1443666 RepID=UPI0009458D7E|nr:hypothetical protein [Aquimarina megaterium]
MKTRLLFLSITLFVSGIINSQSITGLWSVDQVSIGDKKMTPIAKWFKYNTDHSYQAGNGWLQNDEGSWTYNKKEKQFLPESKNGKDEYGAFKVEFSNNKMKWARMEDGMKVIVSLSRISNLPKSPKDKAVGNWQLVSVYKNQENITKSYNPEGKEAIFIRWTGTYRKTHPDTSRSNGYWYMNAHKPELHLIDYNRAIDVQVFIVTFHDNMMTMKPKNSENITFTYKRK